MLYYNKTVTATLKELGTSAYGLPKSEAEERLRLHGPNVIRVKGEPLWRKLFEPFNNVFMLVLFLAALISLFSDEKLDAAIIGIIMLASATIYYVQRFSTERILRSLQKRQAQQISVLRDGKLVDIDSSQIVPGDVFTLSEGEKVPADARLVTADGVRVDESLLTGESVPVSKHEEALSGTREVYEQSNILFQGSFIIAGELTAVVTHTGNSTEFGQIAALAQRTDTQSPVQKKIDKLLSQIISVVGGMAIVAFGLALLRDIEIVEAVRFVMAMSVSAVPESLPVAITVVLVLGMRRMARRKALVRSMRAIETVGVITTIATDKTGTLTKNKLTVQEVWKPSHSDAHLPMIAHRSANNGSAGKIHDPLDTAMIEFASAEHAIELKGTPLHSLPFDHAYSMSGNVWHHGEQYHLNIKGAPEQVLDRCELTENEREEAEIALQKMTSQGYRVIALATTTLDKPIETFAHLHKKIRLEFAGFMAVADELRPEAKKAVEAAIAAGVTVRMITGDHFETAYHIGHQLGMVTERSQVFDSRRMSTMTDDEVSAIIDDIRVFSRVVPENKYRILAILKKHNITAMTGDGVNDVPALSSAHVGVAMGSGSQIAKDASDIILLDNNFRTIVEAMREGRIVTANIRRMLYYLLATNAGETLTMLGALIIGLPMPLVPVQILWINLVTDTSMVIPLGLEPEQKDVMKRKPLPPRAPILNHHMVARMVLVAISMAVLALTLYIIYSTAYGHEYGRTIAFTALVIMQWANAFNARSDRQSIFARLRTWNGPFYIGLCIAVTLQALAVFGPLQGILHITPVAIGDLVITGSIAFILPIVLVEINKWISRRQMAHHDA